MDLSGFAQSWDWLLLSEILGVNLILSGDNAVLIAFAAAGLPTELPARAILFGMVLGVVLLLPLMDSSETFGRRTRMKPRAMRLKLRPTPWPSLCAGSSLPMSR